jgi:hypothetical protein
MSPLRSSPSSTREEAEEIALVSDVFEWTLFGKMEEGALVGQSDRVKGDLRCR